MGIESRVNPEFFVLSIETIYGLIGASLQSFQSPHS